MLPRLCALGLLFTLALPSCLPLIGDQGLNRASCVTSDQSNTLVFKIETATELPRVISGIVNQSLAFDECQTSTSSLFTITREDSHHATLTVIAAPGTKVGDEYFTSSGQPLPNTPLTYYIYGRNACSDDALTFQRGDIPAVTWQAEYADGSACPVSHFTSEIQ